MPLYEFACKCCEKEVDIKLSFDDETIPECPVCGFSMERKFSVPILRGLPTVRG